jgi:type VI secretion system secreted protein VgrG
MGLASKVRIEMGGSEIKDFIDFRVRQSIYGHHAFTVKCRKETFEDFDTFPMENSKKFIGETIKIEMEGYTPGYKSSKPAFFFRGIITDVKATRSGLSENDHIVFSGFSPDILLQDNPGCNSFTNMTVKQIVDKVLASYPKDILHYDVKPNNNDKRLYTVQYNESRYDFIRRLATRFGEWFYFDGTELVFGSPGGKSTDLCVGEDMHDFSFSIRVKPLNYKNVSYNPSAGEEVAAASTSSTGSGQLNEYGSIAHKKSMKLYNQSSVRLNDHLAVEDEGYTKESRSVADLEGNGIAAGMAVASGRSHNPGLAVGNKVVVKAIKEKDKGKVDYGEYLITHIEHACDYLRNYSNSFEMIPSKAKLPDYTNPLAYPKCEPQFAIVTDNHDPDKMGRLKVRFFWQNGTESPWIRQVSSHAGSENGLYFIPEVGDEVLVDFESGDAEKPFILGSLFNGKGKPSDSWKSSGNDFKAIRTRSGNTIELIDKKGSEEIIVYQENDKKAAHHISMKAGSVPELNIFSKGKLILEAKSIEIKSSQGAIEITSSDKVAIKSGTDTNVDAMNVNVKASMNVKNEAGMNLENKAGMNLENKAGMEAKLSGGVMVEITGAIVKIN